MPLLSTIFIDDAISSFTVELPVYWTIEHVLLLLCLEQIHCLLILHICMYQKNSFMRMNRFVQHICVLCTLYIAVDIKLLRSNKESFIHRVLTILSRTVYFILCRVIGLKIWKYNPFNQVLYIVWQFYRLRLISNFDGHRKASTKQCIKHLPIIIVILYALLIILGGMHSIGAHINATLFNIWILVNRKMKKSTICNTRLHENCYFGLAYLKSAWDWTLDMDRDWKAHSGIEGFQQTEVLFVEAVWQWYDLRDLN